LLNVITNEELKERTLTTLLKGYSFATLNKYAKSFAYAYIRDYINPHVFAKLEYHKEHGHKIILVSANLAIYLRHFVSLYQIDGLIATEIEFVECVATGKLATPNCYGAQKVIRICQYLEKNNLQFDYSYGYGNSRGDYELLHYVDEGYMVAGEEFNEWVHDYEK
jgi:phosphatidylglycerophosphatase C